MAKAYESMGAILDASLSDEGIDFLMLFNFIERREAKAYERGYDTATQLYTALLTKQGEPT